MTPIDFRTPSDCLTTSKPLTSALPEVGTSSVVNTRINVDLPAPFGPRRPKISPSATANVIPFTAVKSPKRLTTARTSMAFMFVGLREREPDDQRRGRKGRKED